MLNELTPNDTFCDYYQQWVAMYKEGLEILDGIKSADLDASGVSYYYYQYHQVYTLMADYAFSDQMKEHYRGLAYQYKDSIISMRRPGSQGYLLMMSEKLLYEAGRLYNFDGLSAPVQNISFL